MVKYQILKFIRHIACMGLIIAILVSSAQAMKLPSEYGKYDCFVIAYDFADTFGGDGVYVEPENLSYEKDIVGHAINKIKIGGVLWYIDYGNQRFFRTKNDFIEWYKQTTHFKKILVYDDFMGRMVD